MSAVFKRVPDDLRGCPDVWFPSHRELARLVSEQRLADLSARDWLGG